MSNNYGFYTNKLYLFYVSDRKKTSLIEIFIEETIMNEFNWIDSMLVDDPGGFDDITHREKLSVDQLAAMHDPDVEDGMASHLVDAENNDEPEKTVPDQPYDITYLIQDPSGDLSMVFPKKANISRF